MCVVWFRVQHGLYSRFESPRGMFASLTSSRRPTIHTLTEYCNLLAPGALLGTIVDVVDGLVTIVVDEHGADWWLVRGCVWISRVFASFMTAYLPSLYVLGLDTFHTLANPVWA